jgi:hypothetical protein
MKEHLVAGAVIVLLVVPAAAAHSDGALNSGSACGAIGANCSHPSPAVLPPNSPYFNPHPATTNDGGNRGSQSEEPELSQSDQTWNLTREGGIAVRRYEQSDSPADYQAAHAALFQAFAKIPNYGPAWLKLCELYSQAKNYADATAACSNSMKNGGGGEQYKTTAKDIRKKWLPYLELMQDRKTHDEAVAQYRLDCGSGVSAGQFSGAFAITTGQSEQGLPVDLSADAARKIASCQAQAKALAAKAKGIDDETAAYQKAIE